MTKNVGRERGVLLLCLFVVGQGRQGSGSKGASKGAKEQKEPCRRAGWAVEPRGSAGAWKRHQNLSGFLDIELCNLTFPSQQVLVPSRSPNSLPSPASSSPPPAMTKTYTTHAGWPVDEDEASIRIGSIEDTSESSPAAANTGEVDDVFQRPTNQFVLFFTQLRVMVKRNFILMVRAALKYLVPMGRALLSLSACWRCGAEAMPAVTNTSLAAKKYITDHLYISDHVFI